MLIKKSDSRLGSVHEHVLHTFQRVLGTGAATLVMQEGKVVFEEYVGRHSSHSNARSIQADSQFYVASVRKSYIGFAIAYAVYHGFIENIDIPVIKVLKNVDQTIWKGTTIRHLLTHTHGLEKRKGEVSRIHPPRTEWTYEGVGIEALTEILEVTTGRTVSHILHKEVFQPLQMTQSDWYAETGEKHVDVILKTEEDSEWQLSQSLKGDDKNMYVSARELAMWGNLHLYEGKLNGIQVVPKELIRLATTLQSPDGIQSDAPQNGYLWFVKNRESTKTEIGGAVPRGSFQILGYTGVTLLVIPEKKVVAVRMFNSFGSPEGYDYLEDVRSFGDKVVESIR
ncbi:serine hydrolase domain-containing protein [Halobacillus locisalis]|uniref:serine hydrolase domain-containing protein n=1 Tax=Halobacillus locisalis TaxID=220753 RepID=UPI001FED24BB|nr:serine hydrolase domain-containing protein [Halobacillus locisalis]